MIIVLMEILNTLLRVFNIIGYTLEYSTQNRAGNMNKSGVATCGEFSIHSDTNRHNIEVDYTQPSPEPRGQHGECDARG